MLGPLAMGEAEYDMLMEVGGHQTPNVHHRWWLAAAAAIILGIVTFALWPAHRSERPQTVATAQWERGKEDTTDSIDRLIDTRGLAHAEVHGNAKQPMAQRTTPRPLRQLPESSSPAPHHKASPLPTEQKADKASLEQYIARLEAEMDSIEGRAMEERLGEVIVAEERLRQLKERIFFKQAEAAQRSYERLMEEQKNTPVVTMQPLLGNTRKDNP